MLTGAPPGNDVQPRDAPLLAPRFGYNTEYARGTSFYMPDEQVSCYFFLVSDHLCVFLFRICFSVVPFLLVVNKKRKLQRCPPFDYDESVDTFSAAILFVLFLSKTTHDDDVTRVVEEARRQILPDVLEQDLRLQNVVSRI